METSIGSRAAVIQRRREAGSVVLRRRARLVLLLIITSLLVPSDGYLGEKRLEWAILSAVSGERFDLVSWELQAISQKVRDRVRPPGATLSAEEERDLVLEYMRGVRRSNELSRALKDAAAGMGDGDLAQKQVELQTELDQLRAIQDERRPTVERILEHQVAGVLQELRFTTMGRVFPPVRFQFTESPNLIIVSPREVIRMDESVHLDPTMPLDEIEKIEDEVAAEMDRSTLIEGTGGFSSYPTMVLQSSSLSWVIETVAHEWAHTYLTLHPLGWNYSSSGEMRTINETVASIFGDEISRMVLEKYYPDMIGPNSWPRPLSMAPDWLSVTPVEPEFEFGAFMRETRLATDKLLAEGKVAEAEQYMETRRVELLEEGYGIRRLNQAYFAFHGSYAVGTSATDPIGGKLRALRLRAGGLPEFIQIVARFNDATDLDAALTSSRASNPLSGHGFSRPRDTHGSSGSSMSDARRMADEPYLARMRSNAASS